MRQSVLGILVFIALIFTSSANAAEQHQLTQEQPETQDFRVLVGDSPLSEDKALPAGFEELKTTAAGVAGSFDKNSTHVSFETRRGPKTPAAMRRMFPGTPLYEIDVRFMNADGEVFFAHYGGHGPVSGEWELSQDDSLSKLPSVLADKIARAQFATAALALENLATTKFHPYLVEEHKALTSLASLVDSFTVTEKTEEEGSKAVTTRASSCSYRNQIEIHDQRCSYCPSSSLRHSSTLAKNISSSGTTTQAWVTSNHGTRADQMPLKCTWKSAANRCKLATAPLCITPYSLLGGSGTHVCNDDTDLQYDSVRNNYCPTGTAGTCTAAGVNGAPTSCY